VKVILRLRRSRSEQLGTRHSDASGAAEIGINAVDALGRSRRRRCGGLLKIFAMFLPTSLVTIWLASG
jgi:hypothetical protein